MRKFEIGVVDYHTGEVKTSKVEYSDLIHMSEESWRCHLYIDGVYYLVLGKFDEEKLPYAMCFCLQDFDENTKTYKQETLSDAKILEI